jgi:hypothetical protein
MRTKFLNPLKESFLQPFVIEYMGNTLLVEELKVSTSLKMLFSVMYPVQGPTPVLLIQNNTLIDDKMWLSEYLDTSLRSFNVIGGFYQGEIQNRLVLSVDSDTILLIYGLSLPFFETEGDFKRVQSYQAVITMIFGRTNEVETKLYSIVTSIKRKLELTSFTIQASSRFPGTDVLQTLTNFVYTLLMNGDILSTRSDSISLTQQESVLPEKSLSPSELDLRRFSKREQQILNLAVPYFETELSAEEIVEKTSLTFTELEWVSKTLENEKLKSINRSYDEVFHDLTLEKSTALQPRVSRIKDRLWWYRRRKVSRTLLQELHKTLFSLLAELTTDGRSMKSERIRELIFNEATFLGRRLLADYFVDVGLREIHVTRDLVKQALNSVWQRNFGYFPKISTCTDSTPHQLYWYIIIQDQKNPLVFRSKRFSEHLNPCTMTEGILQGIVEDLIRMDPRFTPYSPIFVDVREIRCKSRGYDHCDFEIRVNFDFSVF